MVKSNKKQKQKTIEGPELIVDDVEVQRATRTRTRRRSTASCRREGGPMSDEEKDGKKDRIEVERRITRLEEQLKAVAKEQEQVREVVKKHRHEARDGNAYVDIDYIK